MGREINLGRSIACVGIESTTTWKMLNEMLEMILIRRAVEQCLPLSLRPIALDCNLWQILPSHQQAHRPPHYMHPKHHALAHPRLFVARFVTSVQRQP